MHSFASRLSTIKVCHIPFANSLGCGQSVLASPKETGCTQACSTTAVGLQAACQVTAFARDSRGNGMPMVSGYSERKRVYNI